MRSTGITSNLLLAPLCLLVLLIVLIVQASVGSAFLHRQSTTIRTGSTPGRSQHGNEYKPKNCVIVAAEPDSSDNIPPRRISTNDDPAFLSQDSNGFTGACHVSLYCKSATYW
jgi:hypothetical protein